MKRKCVLFVGSLAAALVLLFDALAPVRAELRIDITHGKVEPIPIAIPSLAGSGGDEGQAGREIAGVVSADLERSGLRRPGGCVGLDLAPGTARAPRRDMGRPQRSGDHCQCGSSATVSGRRGSGASRRAASWCCVADPV